MKTKVTTGLYQNRKDRGQR